MKSIQFIRILIIVLSFATYYFLFSNFKYIKIELDTITKQGLISYTLTYFIIGTPIFIGTFLLDKTTNILKSLGLSESIFTALWTSILFTLPMFIGGLLFFKFNPNIDFQNLTAGTLIAGFMEELYFRGFLFGQIFKKNKLRLYTLNSLWCIAFCFRSFISKSGYK